MKYKATKTITRYFPDKKASQGAVIISKGSSYTEAEVTNFPSWYFTDGYLVKD